MREYRYPATDETIEALRRLRAPWAGFVAGDRGIVIQLADGAQIEIVSESAEVEPDFEAFRVTARVVEAEADADAPLPRPGTEPVEDFAAGGNDIVVFNSETWIERAVPAPGGEDRSVQFTGRPLQRSESAEAVCAVTDAVVVATTIGTGILVRCGIRPHTIEVVREREAIARFLVDRGYADAEAQANAGTADADTTDADATDDGATDGSTDDGDASGTSEER